MKPAAITVTSILILLSLPSVTTARSLHSFNRRVEQIYSNAKNINSLESRTQSRRAARLHQQTIETRKRFQRRRVNYQTRNVTRFRRINGTQGRTLHMTIGGKSQLIKNRDIDSVLTLVNQERAQYNTSPLTLNNLLTSSAESHARDMLRREYFSHVSPNSKGFKDRIKQTGYLDVNQATCNCVGWSGSVGENIAKGQPTAKTAMQGWMESPGHRKNILSSDFEEIGIAHIGDVWVQNFGRMTLKQGG